MLLPGCCSLSAALDVGFSDRVDSVRALCCSLDSFAGFVRGSSFFIFIIFVCVVIVVPLVFASVDYVFVPAPNWKRRPWLRLG